MDDLEMHARCEALVEIYDGILWQHVEGLTDEQMAVIGTNSYAQAMVNVLVRSMPQTAVREMLADPERGQLVIRRAMVNYPWADVIRRVLAAHQHRIAEEP